MAVAEAPPVPRAGQPQSEPPTREAVLRAHGQAKVGALLAFAAGLLALAVWRFQRTVSGR